AGGRVANDCIPAHDGNRRAIWQESFFLRRRRVEQPISDVDGANRIWRTGPHYGGVHDGTEQLAAPTAGSRKYRHSIGSASPASARAVAVRRSQVPTLLVQNRKPGRKRPGFRRDPNEGGQPGSWPRLRAKVR